MVLIELILLSQFFSYFYITLINNTLPKYMIASILCFFTSLMALAQGDTPPPPTPPPPPGLPIDRGILILFVIALVYGVYKTYSISKKKVA
jgi:hypothetical protein